MAVHSRAHLFAKLLSPPPDISVSALRVLDIPILFLYYASGFIAHYRARTELLRSLVNSHWGRNYRKKKELQDSSGINFHRIVLHGTKSSKARCKEQAASFPTPIQALHAEPIDREHQPLRPFVPQRERIGTMK